MGGTLEEGADALNDTASGLERVSSKQSIRVERGTREREAERQRTAAQALLGLECFIRNPPMSLALQTAAIAQVAILA